MKALAVGEGTGKGLFVICKLERDMHFDSFEMPKLLMVFLLSLRLRDKCHPLRNVQMLLFELRALNLCS